MGMISVLLVLQMGQVMVDSAIIGSPFGSTP
jgi:hypothetical protein